MKPFTLELLTRPACHMCDDAASILSRVAAVVGAGVIVTDVDADPELAVDFGLRIPVVRASSGRVLAEGEVGFARLLVAALRVRIAETLARP